MVRRTGVLVLLLTLLCGLAAAGAPQQKAAPPKDDYYELFKVLVDTMDQVERNYVKEVDRRELIEAAIHGMLAKLDPYSSYISPSELDRFRASVENEFGGIGIQPIVEGGQLTVLSPLFGTPAYRAGILAGDRIVEINGESSEGLSLDKAVERLKGAIGTQVTLTVIHPGSTERQKITITRELIHVETILGDHRNSDDTWDYTLDHEKHIGYIRVTAFSRDTAGELRKAMESLQAAKLRGLILDLRFNAGGLLNSAIEVCDTFVSQGRIVSTVGRNSPERAWDARGTDAFEGFPMAVLVNRYSASASEIVSACLQDHKRALIVGERTWGKGSVQNVIELEDGHSALKLTTAAYRRPSGKNIHRFPNSKEEDEWGVVPDKGYELKLNERETESLWYERRQRDVIQPHPAEPTTAAKTGANPAEKAAAGDDQHPESSQDAATSGQDQPQPDQEGKQPAEPPRSQQSPARKPPSEKPPTLRSPAEKAPRSNPPGPEAGRTAAARRKATKFVDRQLQMAVNYLTGELAPAATP